MNCTEFHKLIDDYCDDELNAGQQAGFETHHASCATCQALLAAEESMLASLKAMPVIGPSEGFADRVLHKAVDSNVGHHQRHGFLVGFGSAVAASLALWVVIGWLPGGMPSTDSTTTVASTVVASTTATSQEPSRKPKAPEISIALNEQRDVKLAFFSSEALKGAKITIRIPENVALVGYPGQRELSWTTDLAKGDNTLRLPIKAIQAAHGELVAHIEYGGRIKTLKVNLDTGTGGVTGSFERVEKLA